MSNRSRLHELPQLRSSKSLRSSFPVSDNLARPPTIGLRACSGPIVLENDRMQTGKTTSPPMSSLQLSSFSSSRPITLKSPDSLPLSRLSISQNAKSETGGFDSKTFQKPLAESLLDRSQPCSIRSCKDQEADAAKLTRDDAPTLRYGGVISQQIQQNTLQQYRCLVGLANLGNTCFMASQLQALGCLSDIIGYFADSKYISSMNTKSPSKGRLVKSFSALMEKLRDGPDGKVIRPSDIKEVLGTICRRFSGYSQQDSQEFLRTLLSGIHDDINEIRKMPPYSEITEKMEDPDDVVSERWWANYTDRNRSFISGLFCGQLKNHVMCTKCSFRSRTFDPFWDLSLQIKTGSTIASSLDDCFRNFTAEESISDYYCSKCKAHVVAKRKMSIHRFPEILVIHLKRFEFSSVLPRKLDTMITFPLKGLNLSRFASETARLKPEPIYDLKAVSNHYGNTSGGHYTAMGMISSTTWAEFNDSSANRISDSVVCSTAAYVLFFRLRHH